ncbi:MAG: hypothetical protein AAF652_17065 [Cyanobacteria bacterium P01_C01_bin.72]
MNNGQLPLSSENPQEDYSQGVTSILRYGFDYCKLWGNLITLDRIMP